MVIEIVWSFSIKYQRRYILTCRRCPLAGCNGVAALCCHVVMGLKPAHSDLSHCDTLNLDETYNCQRLKHVKFL